jgi:peptide chain release factor 1
VRLPQARLDQVLDRFREIEARMGAATEGPEIVRLSKEHAELRPVAEAVRALEKVLAEKPELEAMAADADPDISELARDELERLEAKLPDMERDVALLLAPRDKDENASAILEVRAGTGGDEAALFAGDLFRMYQRYAANRGWRVEIDSISEGEMGGFKEIIASVTGDGVFGRLKFESGVHRVQRVPATEAQGRIHTSAATVAVLPEARTSRSRSTKKTCASTPIGRSPARAVSTSTRPTGRAHHPPAHRHRGDDARKNRSMRTAARR